MNDPKNPVPGDQVIDASEFHFVDITPARVKKLTKLRDGHEDAVTEVLNLKPEDVERAGLNPAELEKLRVVYAECQRTEVFAAAVDKLGELLHEGLALRHHDIGTLLGEFASQAHRRAGRVTNSEEVLGPVKKLVAYQSGPALKAAATRERNSQDESNNPTTNGDAGAGSSPMTASSTKTS